MPTDPISRALAALIRWRVAVLVLYALALPAAIWVAIGIPSDGGIDRLMVPTDPDFEATQAFHKIFPEPQTVLLVFEAPDPWTADAIARVDGAVAALGKLPHVGTFSLLDILRRAHPGATPEQIKQLALGTAFFRHQGLLGDHFLTVIADLAVHGQAERDAALAAIDGALANVPHVRKVGEPYVSAWIENAAARAQVRGFPVFGVLLVAIAVFLFRSARAMLAIVLALGVAVALAVAAGGLCGFTFTIVSVLVPLTVMVTTLASLVYLHSRYVDVAADGAVSAAEHHVLALRNKFLPVTASTLAAAMGFAALAVSKILPIREMGLWTALGLAISWVVAFTLFPALQRVLRAPTGKAVEPKRHVYDHLARVLPALTYRWRWPIVLGTLAACAVALAALVGIPGVISGVQIEVDNLSNIDPDSAVHADLAWFRANVMDLNAARVWIHLPKATATDPEVLHAIDRFQTALEAVPDVTGVTGPTTFLRMRSYLAGKGEALPADPDQFERATEDVEQLMLTEPELRAFIDVNGLADLQLTMLFTHGDAAGYAQMATRATAAWDAIVKATPALAGARAQLVGESLLQVKVGANLVPTLAESFVLTAALIFVVFLLLFKSGIERLLAMIPSLFALLVTFLGLRLFGGTLNVATIIIATTVLGTTENDQIHFFHHMHEKVGQPLHDRLAHAYAVSGRAIVFATLINAAGFLGLSISRFPPLRQFGLMTASAFVLALIADFTALPAALWIVLREKPVAPPALPDRSA